MDIGAPIKKQSKSKPTKYWTILYMILLSDNLPHKFTCLIQTIVFFSIWTSYNVNEVCFVEIILCILFVVGDYSGILYIYCLYHECLPFPFRYSISLPHSISSSLYHALMNINVLLLMLFTVSDCKINQFSCVVYGHNHRPIPDQLYISFALNWFCLNPSVHKGFTCKLSKKL